jgi:OOP family OmpA-OmpF porin
MKKIVAGAACGLALLGAPALSQAQSADEKGFYIGGSMVSMEADGTCPGGFSCDFKDTGWKIFAGYRVNRHLAIEGTYGAWGEITVSAGANRGTGEIDSMGIAAVGILPLGDRFELFAKAGMASSEQRFTVTGPAIAGTASRDETEFHFGLGATYRLTKNFGIRAEWERLDDSEVNLFSLGVQYRF